MRAPAYPRTVIPSEASRRIFFRVRFCKRVGLRSEESLFSLLGARCVKSLSRFAPAIPYPLLTTHFSSPFL